MVRFRGAVGHVLMYSRRDSEKPRSYSEETETTLPADQGSMLGLRASNDLRQENTTHRQSSNAPREEEMRALKKDSDERRDSCRVVQERRGCSELQAPAKARSFEVD